MKITIKVPKDKNCKFKLQSWGNIKGRQFKTSAGLLGSLERLWLRKKLNEKLVIVIKEYIDNHYEIVNESLASNNRDYLIYLASCFLEVYLSPETLKKSEKRWCQYLNKPNRGSN